MRCYDYTTIVDSTIGAPVADDVLWLAGYALAAGAAWTWSVQEPAEPVPEQDKLIDPRHRVCGGDRGTDAARDGAPASTG